MLSSHITYGYTGDAEVVKRNLWKFAAIALVLGSYHLAAAEPDSRTDMGQVKSLDVFPSKVAFSFRSDRQRILVQAQFADGSTRDVTESATFEIQDSQIADWDAGTVVPKAAGHSSAVVTWQNVSSELEITVDESEVSERPLRFRNDILPLLTRAGCNAGKCHGAASGKDGFRLSLYGFDPSGDHFRITREMSGRRVNLARPDECLLVNKATGAVPHTGGMRIESGSVAYRKLVTWIATGAESDPTDTPTPIDIEVYPRESVMSRPGEKQTTSVLAKYSDGSMRDVTDLAVFFSNNEAVATVSESGNTVGTGPGSAFMMARFDQFTAGMPVVVRSGREYPAPDFSPKNYIDELAVARWLDLQVHPSAVCSDEIFLRRVYLDTVGLLPTAIQRQQFLESPAKDKREKLVGDLVSSDAFLDMWIMKLAEMLQIRRANGLTAKGLSLYDSWLRERVHNGATVDEIVRELIPASGGTFDNPPTSYYQTETTPQLLAENIAQAFLGTRIQCAQCHNHPFDRWTMDDYYGFAAFVSQVGYKQAKDPREVTIYNAGEGSLQHPVQDREVKPKFLGGDCPDLEAGEDYREALAEWLTSPDNEAFSQNIANVLWAHFMGIGLVDPVDDMRVSNPPTNPELLKALGEHLVDYKFDVRQLTRDICNSNTYQLATQANAWNEWDDRNFSRGRIRRLRAEVLLDCISQVTHTSNSLSGLPLGGRAIQIPDGSSNNYFLETFGRASRSTPCTCEVSTAPTLSQALHLLNGENTSGKISKGAWIKELTSAGRSPMQVVDAIYVACLSRLPNPQEIAAIKSRLDTSEDPESELTDFFWAILNSNEFIFNH
jgi:hypothetical protein